MVVTSGYLIATTGYFSLILVPRFSDNDLPTGVQKFFLLQATNLTPYLQKLVRTTATLIYGDMKENIQKVLRNSCGKTMVVCQLKKKIISTQIKKVIKRKEIILEYQELNQ